MDDGIRKNQLNIAMLGHKHMLSREGGIEVAVNEMATRMASRGHSIVVYDRNSHHVSREQRTDYKGVRIVPVWTIEKKGLAAVTSSLSAVWQAVWSFPDIIHIHAEGPAVMCGLVRFLWKIDGVKKQRKLVVTIHGLDWKREKWGIFASKYIKFGEKQAAKYADEIIVLNRATQDYFKSTYGRDTVYIQNGVRRPAVVQPADEIMKMWGLEKDSYVLFVGRIVPEKGLEILIEAWKGVKKDKKLVIVGDCSDTEAFYKKIKQMYKGSDIIFTGFQQGRVLEELYSNAYIYTLPSNIEGMPLSLLEALSYGNCCLVSDIPECTEVVEDKAVVFRHSDVESLRTSLQGLLGKPETVEWYKNRAAEHILGNYNWDDTVDRTLEVYRGRAGR